MYVISLVPNKAQYFLHRYFTYSEVGTLKQEILLVLSIAALAFYSRPRFLFLFEAPVLCVLIWVKGMYGLEAELIDEII